MNTDTGATQILAFGEAMVEFNQTGAGEGRLFLQGFGGDTSNFAIAAARQGARVHSTGHRAGVPPVGHLFAHFRQRCEAGFAAIDAARTAGVQVSFGTNLRLKLWPLGRARAVMGDMLRRCDIAPPSRDDITAITGLADPEAIVDRCPALGARTVSRPPLHAGRRHRRRGHLRRRLRRAPGGWRRPARCRPLRRLCRRAVDPGLWRRSADSAR